MKLDLVTCSSKQDDGESISPSFCEAALKQFFARHPDLRVAQVFGITRDYWKQRPAGSGDDGILLASGTTRLGVLSYTRNGPDPRAKDLEVDNAACDADLNRVETDRLRAPVPPGVNGVIGPLACPEGVRTYIEAFPRRRVVAIVSLSELGKGAADEPGRSLPKAIVESGTTALLFVRARD